MRLLHALFVFCGLSAIAAAVADAQPAAATLQCDGDEAAIRLGVRFYSPVKYYKFPPEREKRWQSVPVAGDNACTLANGDRVVLHAGLRPASGPYDPIAIASVWINERKIVSGQEIEPDPFGMHGPYLNSIFLSPGAVEKCSFPDDLDMTSDAPFPPTNVRCVAERYELAKLPVDAMLPFPVDRSLIGTLSIAAAHSRAFCELFVMSYDENGVRYELARAPFRDEIVWPFDASGEALTAPYGGKDLITRIATARFWNSDEVTTMAEATTLSLRGITRPVILVRSGNIGAEQRTQLANARWVYDADENRKTAASLGWRILGADSDDDPGIVQAFTMKGEMYVLQEWDDGSAALHRPNAAHGFEPICRYQPVRDNF